MSERDDREGGIINQQDLLLMNKNFLSVAALLGALSVALGAFAAHKLKEIVSPDAVAIPQRSLLAPRSPVLILFSSASQRLSGENLA